MHIEKDTAIILKIGTTSVIPISWIYRFCWPKRKYNINYL